MHSHRRTQGATYRRAIPPEIKPIARSHMAHRTTVFEREPLYAEVWKEPVSIVAKRYGISDVALRKICLKLGVPVPPLGYWAEVAAGQQPRVTKLPENHKGDTRYVRSYYHDPEEESERKARIRWNR